MRTVLALALGVAVLPAAADAHPAQLEALAMARPPLAPAGERLEAVTGSGATSAGPSGVRAPFRERPAPVPALRLAQAGGHDGHAGHDMGAMPAEAAASAEAHPSATPGSATVGSIRIEGGFVRAMLPGQKVGGGYLTIVNTGVDADRLLSVSTDAARRGSLHEMEMSGDVMRMRELAGGIDIPAGGSVSLSPGGTHLMFTEVDRPFATGTAVEVTLVFERAGPVSVVLPVAAPGAKAAGGIHDGHRP